MGKCVFDPVVGASLLYMLYPRGEEERRGGEGRGVLTRNFENPVL